MVKVMIIDGSGILRSGIKHLLEQCNEIRVVGNASDYKKAIENCQELNPDVVILDIRTIGFDGFQTIKIIKQDFPNIRLIIFSEGLDREEALLCLKYKVDGFIKKDVEPQELISVVKNSFSGILSFHNDFIEIISTELKLQEIEQNYKKNIHLYRDDLITYEEVKLIQMIIQGDSEKEIAAKFNIAISKVHYRKSNLYKKLKVSNTVQLALYAAKTYIV